jgi:hypothetical protein
MKYPMILGRMIVNFGERASRTPIHRMHFW